MNKVRYIFFYMVILCLGGVHGPAKSVWAGLSTEAIGTEAIGTAISGSYCGATIWCILQKLLVQLSGSYCGATIWCVLLVYWYSYLEAIVEQLSGVYYWCIGTATWNYCVIDWNIR